MVNVEFFYISEDISAKKNHLHPNTVTHDWCLSFTERGSTLDVRFWRLKSIPAL